METFYKTLLDTKLEINSDLIMEDFRDYLNDITCLICLKIVFEPVICGNCSTIFCKTCIEGWLNKNQNCPMRCIYKESKLSNLSLNFLNKLKIYCTNKEKGCLITTHYDELNKHLENNCEYTICECNGCQKKLSRIEMKSHLTKCEKLEIECPECSIKVTKPMFQDHCQNFCTGRDVICKDCNKSFSFSIIDSHNLTCNLSEIVCDYCFKNFKKSEKIENHSKDECVNNIRNYYIQIINFKDTEIKKLKKFLRKKRKKLKNQI